MYHWAPLGEPTPGLIADAARSVIEGRHKFLVVGIGASAGGLNAITALLDAGRSLASTALLIVQHLDSKGESHLAELLARHTPLVARSAVDGVEIVPGHIYVGVPSHDLIVDAGRLRLVEPRAERSERRPIDRLFDSIASAYGERGVAVVLSGTGSDGSRGIAAVKSAGGLVIVQDPTTVEYDGMPRSAIGTGLADLVLPVEEIPQAIDRVVAHTATSVDADTPTRPETASNDDVGSLEKTLDALRERFGYDFRDYKRPTLWRRTQRRMNLRNIDDLGTYAALIRDDENEAATLFRDLMINVSGFFRDPAAWETLSESVLDPLIAARENGDGIRVWSVGCATGEEAYTIGMTLTERMEAIGRRLRFQIFATDVSDSLAVARDGRYPLSIAGELSTERLERFFVRSDDGFEVRKSLRDQIVFARHNVINDPPFSRMDLVCCRNLLIYIEPETQRKILWAFNFALRDNATLFLGSAETIDTQTDLFEPISAPWRIYRSRRVRHARRFQFPRFSLASRGGPPEPFSSRRQVEKEGALPLAQRVLLERFAPPAVVVDGEGQVLVYQGDTSRLLIQPGGEPTRDLYAMVPMGLRPALRQAIAAALGPTRPDVAADGWMKRNGVRTRVEMNVTPLGASSEDATKLLITFREIPATTAGPDDASAEGAAGRPQSDVEVVDSGSQTVAHIEEELRVARQEAREIAAQHDRLVEEFSASNEEMLSVNEEFQSTNEELETSKEELQSLNEELNTLNNELRSKVDIVEQTNNDLSNLLASTEIATLFLDAECRIRWFTPAVRDILHLIPADIGRPVRDLASSVRGASLDQVARRVLHTLVPVESEVQSEVEGGPEGESENGVEGNRTFLRRVLPYRTSEDRVDGVVATYIDVTEHRKARQQRERLMHELSHRIKNTLATVQAMVQGLGAHSADVPSFLAAFESRLAALARAHSLLSMPGHHLVDIRVLINRELEPYVGKTSSRVTTEGSELSLARTQSIAMALVLHELVTNATKYGALSVATGTVAVRWRERPEADGNQVVIEWIESGGPPPPENRKPGFGTLLIGSTVTHDLGGEVRTEYKDGGLHCSIEFPIRNATQEGREDAATYDRATADGRRFVREQG